MFPVEVHTLGQVHYMLVEGLSDARSWAAAIECYSGDEERGSPQDEVCEPLQRNVFFLVVG